MTVFVEENADLDAVLAEAMRALTVLDAAAIEALAEWLEGNLERVRLPGLPATWVRLRSRRWILGHLLDGTGKRLDMLRRVSLPEARFGVYDGRAVHSVSINDASRYHARPLARPN